MNNLDYLIEGVWSRLGRSIQRGTCAQNIRVALVQELTDLLCKRQLVKRLGGI